MIHRPTRPKPRKQPEHLAIRDPFKRALVRELRGIAEALDRNTAAIADLRERVCVFVQRPAVPVRSNGKLSELRAEAEGEGVSPPWLDDASEAET